MSVKRKVLGETGRHYFKSDLVRYTGDDPKEVEAVWKSNKPIPFAEKVDLLSSWAKAILRKACLPDTERMWKTKDEKWTAQEPNDEDYAGGCRIDHYINKVAGFDPDSVPGLASRIIALVDTMRSNGGTAADGFDLGALSERLMASQYLDARHQAANRNKARAKEANASQAAELFTKIEKRDGLKPYTVAQTIRSRWAPKDQAPSRDTIIRYLRSKNLIK